MLWTQVCPSALLRITVFWASRRDDVGNVPPQQKLSSVRAEYCSWAHVTMTRLEEGCDCAEYAEIAQQASTAGFMAEIASFAGDVATLVTEHSGQPAVSKHALVVPAQTLVPRPSHGNIGMQVSAECHAGYAEFALQASIAGSMSMVASLAWRVATLDKQHRGEPAVSRYALVGPSQTTIISSEVAERQGLHRRGRAYKDVK